MFTSITTSATNIILSKLRNSFNIQYEHRTMSWADAYSRLVGWKINVPFQHKNRLYRVQDIGWRFSSARLRMANDTVTS